MRKVNLDNGKITTEVPVEVKRKLYEKAQEKCMTVPVFVKLLLLDWYEGNNDA